MGLKWCTNGLSKVGPWVDNDRMSSTIHAISSVIEQEIEIHSFLVILKNTSCCHKISPHRFRFQYDRPDNMKIVIRHQRMYWKLF